MSLIRICPSCGNPLPSDAPAGLCPVCLLKTDAGANPPAKGPSEEPTSTLTIGPEAFVRVRYFGDYELLEEIARGGMGVVWKARQASLNRTVAVKMILAGKLAGEAEVQRFHREAEAAANLQHPNIVAIHEVGEHDGQHYYSMDYVQGRDLGALVREGGPLSSERAAVCLKTLAEAVHFAHQRGTLHRDLKPQNVLMDAAGVPRITDFGLAKFVERDDNLTKTGAAMGSPSYMPPEQAAGHLDQLGPHSDVYSLGAILYELLTGRPPFRAETAMATMRQVMESDPVPPRKVNPGVPPDLETICLKCLEKNPALRYPSARALAEEMGRFLKHEPIQALPVSAIRKTESWLRRHPWTLMAAGSLVIMVLMGTLYWQYERVKFLGKRPSLTDQALLAPGLRSQLDIWTGFYALGVIIMIGAFCAILQRYAQGRMVWNDIFNRKRRFERRTVWEPAKPMSQRMGLLCVLMSVVTLVCTALYFAKVIQVRVWCNGPLRPTIAACFYLIFGGFTFSLWLLFRAARDYQKFIHGMPSRTLTSEQSESLRQAIRNNDLEEAWKLYRRTFPDASQLEAIHYVQKFSDDNDVFGVVKEYRKKLPGASVEEVHEACAKRAAAQIAELKAKRPELFTSPKLSDLNWRKMGKTLVVQAGVFAVFWLIAPPPVSLVIRLLVYAAWFLCGAGTMTFIPVQRSWKRVLGIWLCYLLPIVVTAPFYQEGLVVFLFSVIGYLSGTSMLLSGFTRKRRNSVPGKRAPKYVSPPH
jgi:tRNA A-37 threonylcarbamoyl transferase component Bud32